MHSKDETVRLRAADAFLKRQERQTGCPTCEAAREDDRERMSAIHRLTYEQRCRVTNAPGTGEGCADLAPRSRRRRAGIVVTSHVGGLHHYDRAAA